MVHSSKPKGLHSPDAVLGDAGNKLSRRETKSGEGAHAAHVASRISSKHIAFDNSSPQDLVESPDGTGSQYPVRLIDSARFLSRLRF